MLSVLHLITFVELSSIIELKNSILLFARGIVIESSPFLLASMHFIGNLESKIKFEISLVCLFMKKPYDKKCVF
jgi:hypothetical protein